MRWHGLARLISDRRIVVHDQTDLNAGAWIDLTQALPGTDQRLEQSVGPNEECLYSESARKLGRLELVPHHQTVESQHQIVDDTRAPVGHANPQQLSTLQFRVNSRTRPFVLPHIATHRPTLAFCRRQRLSFYNIDRRVRFPG
ncbi:hypothetical protein D9M68_472870 [compost metagenome]